MSNTWYLVVDHNSNRFFIKEKENTMATKYYIVKEDSIIVDIISLSYLQKNNYIIVGDAFDSESKRLNRLLEDVVF